MESIATVPVTPAIEKFSAADLSSLRDELTQSGLDHWQAAELIGSFLSGAFARARCC